jgi:MFS family permease
MDETPREVTALSTMQRYVILITAFTGWMFAGTIMSIIPLGGREALRALGVGAEANVGVWFSYCICAFLLGAAAGGFLFGWLGDRLGRAKAMGMAILWYSCWTGGTYFVESPTQLVVLRFIACLGVGGMWPNGVALVSEAWSEVSRPLMAGLIGTSANLGFVLLAIISYLHPITIDRWRWVMLVGAGPVVLGMFVLVAVAESPRWLASRQASHNAAQRKGSPAAEIFRRPLVWYTLIGICLGAVPLLGNWGGSNWLIPWASAVGGPEDTTLKSAVQATRSSGAALGSLLGGWLASQFGRRSTYFAISLGSLASSLYLFYFLTPTSPRFLWWVFVMGFFGTIYFGWLPLYLPELFPTRVRATGTGVSFNFGRILATVGVLGAGSLMTFYEGNYARVGQTTSLVYVLGMVVICLAPDTSKRRLEDD